ncbi:MAG: hypothetical protein C0402_13880 [Thermodesulfovibrio sp.]|nr:hypothetical protein [Thermodesulfovibrio sp.]
MVSLMRDSSFPVSVLSTERGREFFCCLEAPVGLPSGREALTALLDCYDDLIRCHALGTATEVVLRFHLSDDPTGSEYLRKQLNLRGTTAICSFICQPPASGSACCLEAYHMDSAYEVSRIDRGAGLLQLGHSQYTSFRTVTVAPSGGTAVSQTAGMFDLLAARLRREGASLQEHLLRTWIYLRDIDNDYTEFSDARRDWFDAAEISGSRWIPASTAIGAAAGPGTERLQMDALAVAGLSPGQVTAMHAPDHLCQARAYGVTFERGLKVAFGDRTHYYLSGTASIDRDGSVLFPGDPEAQTLRIIENMGALLSPYGGRIEDLKIIIVYMRNMSDYEQVSALLQRVLPSGIPRILVQGAVCRVPWLVEIEGIAMTDKGDERFADFF